MTKNYWSALLAVVADAIFPSATCFALQQIISLGRSGTGTTSFILLEYKRWKTFAQSTHFTHFGPLISTFELQKPHRLTIASTVSAAILKQAIIIVIIIIIVSLEILLRIKCFSWWLLVINMNIDAMVYGILHNNCLRTVSRREGTTKSTNF